MATIDDSPRRQDRRGRTANRFPVEPLRVLMGRAFDHGWERGHLADEAGVSGRCVYRVMKENTYVELATADAICTALGVHVGDVYPEYWGA